MFGNRLKLARKKAGMSLRSLSDAIGNQISAQAIGKYERGEMMPGSRALAAITKALGVSAEYLLSNQVEALECVEFRKLSATSAKERAGVEAAVIERLERYLTVERVLDLRSREWRAPQPKYRPLDHVEEAEDLAVALRKTWQLGNNPIPNMTELLEEHGIKVIIIPLPTTVSGLTCLVRQRDSSVMSPVIVVNYEHTLERRRLTLAHELGHRLIDEKSPVNHEKASNAFAGAFLVPKEHLIQEIGKHRNALGYRELILLKRLYRVSAASLLIRLNAIGIISQQTLRYAFQTFAKGWRKEEPEPIEAPNQCGEFERPHRFERLCYRALAEQYISSSKAVELLQQPIEEIRQAMRGAASCRYGIIVSNTLLSRSTHLHPLLAFA